MAQSDTLGVRITYETLRRIAIILLSSFENVCCSQGKYTTGFTDI
jgi:hypothetical protein